MLGVPIMQSLRTFTATTSQGVVTVLAYSFGNAYRMIVLKYGLNIEIHNIEIGG